MAEYKLGKFTFSSEEELVNAKKELAQIKVLKDKYNTDDPNDARAIISEFQPKTILGEKFVTKLNETISQSENDDIFDAIDASIVDDTISIPLDIDLDLDIDSGNDLPVFTSSKPSNDSTKKMLGRIVLYIVGGALILFVSVALIKWNNKREKEEAAKKAEKNRTTQTTEPASAATDNGTKSQNRTNESDAVFITSYEDWEAFLNDPNSVGRRIQVIAGFLKKAEEENDNEVSFLTKWDPNSQEFYGTRFSDVDMASGDEFVYVGIYTGKTKKGYSIFGEEMNAPLFSTVSLEKIGNAVDNKKDETPTPGTTIEVIEDEDNNIENDQNEDESNKAFIDEVQGSMSKTLKELESVFGPGGCECYVDGDNIVLDYWVDNSDAIINAYYSGVKSNGLTHYEALTDIGWTAAQYYNVMGKYGIDSKKTGFIVNLLYNGDKDRALAFWVNGKYAADSVTGYKYSK